MKRFLHNVAERIKSMRQGRRGTVYELVPDDTGISLRWLTLENETGEIGIQWTFISAVKTFKRDQFTVDCICLAFCENGRWFEVNEDMKGWDKIIASLPDHLPGFPKEEAWLPEVARHPFATNEKMLWERTGQNKAMQATPQ